MTRLPATSRPSIEDLVAEHSIFHSRGQLGHTDYTDAERASLPSVRHKLVRVHPGSKRKTLYMGAHASHIVGWPMPEGRLLLRDLMEHATQREFVYRHTWRVGDLVIWDNRCTLHRGRAYDDATHPRDLRRVTTKDVASPGEVVTASASSSGHRPRRPDTAAIALTVETEGDGSGSSDPPEYKGAQHGHRVRRGAEEMPGHLSRGERPGIGCRARPGPRYRRWWRRRQSVGDRADQRIGEVGRPLERAGPVRLRRREAGCGGQAVGAGRIEPCGTPVAAAL